MATRRVIAWGTGGLGRAGIRTILAHPDLELVGAYTHSAEKIGLDAGELAKANVKAGVPATDDRDYLLGLNADCVGYFANSANRENELLADTIPFLESGTNVSTISHFDLQYPQYGRAEFVTPIEVACQRGNASIFLTGDDPGWAFGQLLYNLLGVAGRIDRIDIAALSHVQFYSGRASLEMYGFNEPLDYRPPMFTSEVGRVWHVDTLRGIADFLGVTVDGYREEWQTAGLSFDFDTTAYGQVRAGATAATYWTVTATVAGKPFIEYHKVLRLHEMAAPEWPKSAKGTGRENAKIIRITGDPSFETEVTRTGETSLTPVSAVTAIPWVCQAAPGILDQRHVPLFPARLLSVPTRLG